MSPLFLSIAALMVAMAITVVIRAILAQGIPLRGPAVSFAVLMPLLAVGLYVYLGTPAAAVAGNQRTLVTTDRPLRESPGKLGSVFSLVDGLAERLEREPNDASGWMLLARSYEHLGRTREAAEAYNRAKSLGMSDEKLETLTPARAKEARARAEIHGSVSLSSIASSSVQDSDSVFVFAKAVNGSPVPLAVIRKPAAELPFDFVLSDDNSMVKGMSLSAFDQVVITARISRSGNVMESEPGLEVRSDPVSVTGADPVYLRFTIPARMDES